ncbi:DUF4153 domain-containing protein [Microbispora sp. NPDC049125]|uniref:DUF4153 domain-containing protein n=1 Tax=Microbispora sp. NPDC049125 TaxID=3154929 RepID=UPI003467438B
MRPLDFLGRIKAKLGIVIVLAVVAAFAVNEAGIAAGLSREIRIAIAVVLALIMVQLLARGMIRPLREMAAAAQTIAKGRYGLRVTATSRDEVGELARAFNAMAADLGKVDRQRRELVANVSHELRTPITGLQAVLENVVDGVSQPDLDTLGTALAQTQRLGRLVAQLLDLSRLDSGARLIDPEELDLASLCRQAASEAAIARDDVTVVSRVPSGIAVFADPALLAQVLANLLDNGVRHSPPGGTVVLEARRSGTALEISVTDSGPGIPAAERARVFERFSRLDAGRAADSGGAGLGLAIAKEIAELHGGSVFVGDSPGGGAPGRTAEGREIEPGPAASGARSGGCRMVVALPAEAVIGGAATGREPFTGPVGVAGPGAGDDPKTAGDGPPAEEAGSGGGLGRPARTTPQAVDADRGVRAEGAVTAVGAESAGTVEGVVTGGAVAGEVLTTDERAGPAEGAVPAGNVVAAGGAGSVRPAVPVAYLPGAHPAEVRVGTFRAALGAAIGMFGGFAAGLFVAFFLGLYLGGVYGPIAMLLFTCGGAAAGAAIGSSSGAGRARRSPPPPAWDGVARHVPASAATDPARMTRTTGAGTHSTTSTASTASTASTTAMTDTTRTGRGGRVPNPDDPRTAREIGTAAPASPGSSISHSPTAAASAPVAGTVPSGSVAAEHAGGSPPMPWPQPSIPAGTTVATAGPLGQPGPPGQGAPVLSPHAVQPAPAYGQAHYPPPPPYVPPPLFPRPELPDAPRWLLPVVAAVGLVAAIALPYASTGLGLVLTAVVMGAAVLPALLIHGRERLTPWTAGLGVVAYALVSVALFRSADWLVAPALLAAFGIAALALSGGGSGWPGVIRGGASVLLAVFPLPWFLSGPVRSLIRHRRLLPTLISVGLTVILLGVFGLLFSAADAVFSAFVSRLPRVPDWADGLPPRIFVFAVFAVLVAAAVLVALRPVAEPASPDLRMPISRGVWMIPLVGLNLLFALFVAVQITVLFGGNRRVLSTAGLTYAEYARSGFFELMTVSLFVLGIVGAAVALLRLRNRGDRWVLAVLLGLLCAFTLVVLASALHRLGLYTDAYGLSRLRAAVGATILWLGAVFVMVLAAGAVRLRGGGAGWFSRSLVLLTGVSLLVFAVWNPDARVAETQLTIRGVARLDHNYLGDLGAEAVPTLDRLPEPARSCVLRDVVAVNHLDRPDGWNGWNLARASARDLLKRHPVLETANCPVSRYAGSGD